MLLIFTAAAPVARTCESPGPRSLVPLSRAFLVLAGLPLFSLITDFFPSSSPPPRLALPSLFVLSFTASSEIDTYRVVQVAASLKLRLLTCDRVFEPRALRALACYTPWRLLIAHNRRCIDECESSRF